MSAALRLTALCGVEAVAIGAAMLQTSRWRATLAGIDPKWPARVFASLATPLLTRAPDGTWRGET